MSNSGLDLVFPSVENKIVVGSFDGGDVTSDTGLFLLREADRKIGLIKSMAEAMEDRRDQDQVKHKVFEMLRARVYGIAAGYEDANDLETLRSDPALKAVCDRLPVSGNKLASQPTISRFENAITRKDLLCVGMMVAERVI